MTHTTRTICNRDCPDSCAVLATVAGGRVVEHVGDPDHGITRGFLCQRGNRYLERFYSPDRVLHPMRRTDHGWQRLSWDDALDLAAERLLHVRDTLGPTSIAHVSYSGIHGLVARTLGRRFWAWFGGATHTLGGMSVEAIHAAQHMDLGGSGCHALRGRGPARGELFNPSAWRGDLQGVNQLRVADLTDVGDAAAMHETHVTIDPI